MENEITISTSSVPLASKEYLDSSIATLEREIAKGPCKQVRQNLSRKIENLKKQRERDFGEAKPLTHRLLPQRMLAAVEDRVRFLNANSYNAKRRARAQEAAEILGILRNVVRAYEDTETPV